jgi:Rrf2 family iron-sulfur cluster assembly transcriptional regulator
MQLTTRGRYGVMAMAELAARQTERRDAPVAMADIAAAQQLSPCYLEQLFGGLRRAGLIHSVRGPGGGYLLAQPAEDVTIAAILAAVGETTRVTRCDGMTANCMGPSNDEGGMCRTHDLWEALGRHIESFLNAITLADVLAGTIGGMVPALTVPNRRAFA